jgi:hypothetical protein
MLLGLRVSSIAPQLLTVLLIASVFGSLAFLYSLLGFFNNEMTNNTFDALGSLTPQEIAGHFLFGYIVALPTRNLKLGMLAGLMALTIDADHLLNVAGFDIQSRMGHSVSFAVLSSFLMGFIVPQFFRKILVWKKIVIPTPTVAASSSRTEEKAVANSYNSLSPAEKNSIIFFQFLIITLAAYLSHIAYDVFVGAGADFPLLAPFNFSDVFIPQMYALPIEGVGILIVYLWYSVTARKKMISNQR